MIDRSSKAPRRPRPSAELREGSAVRLDLLETRAARARRRLLITIVLLLAAAGMWIAAYFAVVAWPWALIPSALLLTVLILGRAAAISDRKANERWSAQRRRAARAAASARALASGGPQTPRNRAIIGAKTEMVPQPKLRTVDGPAGLTRSSYFGERNQVAPVRTDALEPVKGDPAAVSSVGFNASGVVALDTFVDESELAEVFEPVSEPTPAVAAAEPGSAAEPISVAGHDDQPLAVVEAAPAAELAAMPVPVQPWAPRPVPVSEGELAKWTPRDLPLPTYLDKAAAPRRAPLLPPALTEDTLVAETPALSEETGAHPSSQSLGIPLDQILARRRQAS